MIDLYGNENAEGDLTNPYEQEVSRPTKGRKSEVSDPELYSRRDRLLQIFQHSWGEIGWELQGCRKPEDLIRIFTPVAAPGSWFRDEMMLFCHPCSEAAPGPTLRKVRAELAALIEPMRAADESNRRAKEQLQQVTWALTQAHGRSRRIVKQARKARRKIAWKTEQLYLSVRRRELGLEERLRDLRAAFARQELVRFLKSKRYSLTPLSLANAAAGLPSMGWRRSMQRSAKAPCALANGLRYQVFKAIQYLATNAVKKTEDGLVITFEDSIPTLPSRYRLAKIEIAEKWFYLERALRQAYRAKVHQKALPYEITKRYFNQLSSQSPVHMILADHAKLTLGKQQRSRTRPQRDDKI